MLQLKAAFTRIPELRQVFQFNLALANGSHTWLAH